ncbi:MAG TPA: NUDIX domain-containing protein [Bacilli bacterium]|nr:NUDIX domain-containing protein [Bacilli bacterium]
MESLSYILRLRNSLKDEYRNMPLFQNGSALIVLNDKNEMLLVERTDRDLWCLPGSLQELGETFEEVAIRELKEETGLMVAKNNLILIDVISGESRKNIYPNGDQVYNNTVLYLIKKYEGELNCNYSEIVDTGTNFVNKKESKKLKFFDINNLPTNLMDIDLINRYKDYINFN